MSDLTVVKKKLHEVMDEVGIWMEDDETELKMSEIISDSFQYISFIVAVEQAFGVELPEEMLIIDELKSFNNFAECISQLLINNMQKGT